MVQPKWHNIITRATIFASLYFPQVVLQMWLFGLIARTRSAVFVVHLLVKIQLLSFVKKTGAFNFRRLFFLGLLPTIRPQ